MNKLESFRLLCQKKLPQIKPLIKNRNVMIWGASDGGAIVKKSLEDLKIATHCFIDRKYKIQKNFLELPIENPNIVSPKTDFIIIAIISFRYEIEEHLFKLGFTHQDYCYIYDNEAYNKEDIIYKNCKIGRYTYGYEYLLEYYPFASSIGRYCSINRTAKIWNNHPVEYVTTHPMLDYRMFYSWEKQETRTQYCNNYGKYFSNAPFESSPLRKNEPIIIGNDVWIGANVVILPGVHIGDGAILAAGAVVTKDVEPYSIAGGVPAKEIKKRFSKEEIQAFLEIKWWDWSIEKVEENIELFYQPKKFLKKFI